MRPDAWQRDVLLSSASRMILLCCRQAGKSTVTAALACFEALFRPSALVLLLSPTLRQSSELFRKVVAFYRSVPGTPRPLADSTLRMELKNGSRIVSLPGTEETVRGYSGVSLLIVDEASRVPDPLYLSVRPMLAVSGGRLVVLSTPWGKRGWFYEAWHSAEPWERYRVTADQCPRISAAFLEEERRNLGSLWFSTEYLCEFSDLDGSVFPAEFVRSALDSGIAPLFG